MRFFAVLAILGCLLALCSSTSVGISVPSLKVVKYREVFDTTCYQVDSVFNGTSNQVAISGYPTSFFANSDCSYLVGVAYHTASTWQNVLRPIRSFSVLSSW